MDYSLGGFSVGTVDLVDYSVGGFIVGTVWTIVWVDLSLEQCGLSSGWTYRWNSVDLVDYSLGGVIVGMVWT